MFEVGKIYINTEMNVIIKVLKISRQDEFMTCMEILNLTSEVVKNDILSVRKDYESYWILFQEPTTSRT